MQGRQFTVIGTGLLARHMQDETDHLPGIVCVDLLPGDERAVILTAAGAAAPSALPISAVGATKTAAAIRVRLLQRRWQAGPDDGMGVCRPAA